MFEPLSKEFLLNRGFCCKNGCLNCPYKEKIMNFNEYWEDFKKNKSLCYNYDEIAIVTWDTCKNEVLKILKECNEFYKSPSGSDDFRVGESVFKKINNL